MLVFFLLNRLVIKINGSNDAPLIDDFPPALPFQRLVFGRCPGQIVLARIGPGEHNRLCCAGMLLPVCPAGSFWR
jgi:hypothetical protein